MTTSQYITIKWLDPRLTWNPEDFGGITQIRLPSHLFWNPEIALYNKYVPFYLHYFAINHNEVLSL